MAAAPPQRRLNSRWRLLVLWSVFALADIAGAQNTTANATVDPFEGAPL